MATQPLKQWASEINLDGLDSSPQRRDILDEEFRDGWLRNMSVSPQQLNGILHLLTVYANPYPSAPVLFPSSKVIPDEALEMNGQAVTEADNPNAYAWYGTNLPDLTGEAPTGFTYIIRNS